MLEILFNWFILHSALIIELLGVLFALVYLWFSIRQKIWLWPFGILTSAFYIYVFYHSRLYADMGLQVYYLVVSIYGWYNWLYGGKKGKKDTLPVRAVNRRITGILLSVTFVVYWVLVWMLTFIPHWLAIPSSQWLVWIAVDAVSMGLYIYKGLYLTAGLFLVYATMAVIGYLQWRQGMNAESIPSEETKI